MNNDQRIKEILAKYGEDIEAATWRVQGQRVIYHAALERIAAQAGVRWMDPVFLISTPDHAVMMASGKVEDHYEWSVGEAQIGINYRVSGKQAAYPFAMAEKRAKDRVILKLIALHGLLYSEEEADEFKRFKEWPSDIPQPRAGDKVIMPDGAVVVVGATEAQESPNDARREIMSDAISSGKPIELDDGIVHPGEALKRRIQEHGTAIGIKNLMLKHEVQVYLSSIPEDQKDELRAFALARMADLGWKKGARSDG